MKRLAVLLVLLVAACGSGGHGKASPTPSPGPGAFLAFAHSASFGTKDFTSATDDQLMGVGNTVCEGFSQEGLSFGRVVQGLVESAGSPSSSEAEAFARQAVLSLCPQYDSQLP